MQLKLQLFGGRGLGSGGVFKGTTKPDTTGVPNSKYIYYKNGKRYQDRWYDKDGKAIKDRDYTDHGRPDKHPDVPHDHYWDWAKPDSDKRGPNVKPEGDVK